MQFDTPVLFLVFNRPDTTKLVFEKIREVKPRKLFIAADGPRDGKEGEREKCEEVRNHILNSIDWPCEVNTLFREKNLGCGLAVSGAITWFFEHVEEGIILEDDTLPDHSFFRYCNELLEKFRNESRVGMIAGFNMVPRPETKNSYRFSRLVPIWGWATWRDRWRFYDFEMNAWKTYDHTQLNYFRDQTVNVFQEFERQSKQVNDTWDTQWAFCHFSSGLFSIIPKVSLIRNIGFIDGTHTKFDPGHHFNQLETGSMDFPMKHPASMIPIQKEDIRYLRILNHSTIIHQIKRKIKKTLKMLFK